MATQSAQSGGGAKNNNGGIVIGVKGANIGTDSPISSGVNSVYPSNTSAFIKQI